MESMCSRTGPQGLTLIELMVVFVIFSVIILVALPRMSGLVAANRVQSEVIRLVSSINLARSEALKRNLSVTMCPSAAASTGDYVCGGRFADGWIIFSDRDRDRELDADDDLIKVFEGLPGGFSLTNRTGTRDANEKITYRPDGTSGRNRTLLVCPPPGAGAPSRSVVMNITGRPRVAAGWGDCPRSIP